MDQSHRTDEMGEGQGGKEVSVAHSSHTASIAIFQPLCRVSATLPLT